MTANYTKGEWIPYQRKGNNVSICVKSSDKEVVVLEIASLNPLLGYDTVIANASLIASAPTMYEALQLWTRHNQGTRGHYCSECATAIEKTLAKAEGRNA